MAGWKIEAVRPINENFFIWILYFILMHLPNYNDGSIVNLMSSIAGAFNGKTGYNALRILPAKELKKSKNIVLLVIDGLGHEYLKEKKYSFLHSYLRGHVTSVFPPTTASAITTFLTGVPPQQHAYTGWYVYLKEVGMIAKILRFVSRGNEKPLAKLGADIKKILLEKSFGSKIKTKSYVIQPEMVAFSEFSILMSKNSKITPYRNLNGLFDKIKKAIKSPGKKYVYSYWPGLDELNHIYGENSKKSNLHFDEINNKLRELVKSIKNTNTMLIITGDHGFVNSNPKSRIWLNDHPKLKQCLSAPFSGEPRVVYCSVHSSKINEFEKYVKTKLKKYCYLIKSRDLVKKNYFGLGKANKQVFDRIGDYALIMKKNYILKDIVKGERKTRKIGHHGGVSKEEMLVPLVLIKC